MGIGGRGNSNRAVVMNLKYIANYVYSTHDTLL